jgi:hypothetical protein
MTCRVTHTFYQQWAHFKHQFYFQYLFLIQKFIFAAISYFLLVWYSYECSSASNYPRSIDIYECNFSEFGTQYSCNVFPSQSRNWNLNNMLKNTKNNDCWHSRKIHSYFIRSLYYFWTIPKTLIAQHYCCLIYIEI